MLSPERDLIAAKLFLRLALSGAGPRPRVINVDGHPAYASAIAELKQSGELGRHCRRRTAPYLNNIIEQDHRFIKKRITASLGFRSVEGACRTIEGYEAMHAIRKGQLCWVAKGGVVTRRQFIHAIPGLPARRRFSTGDSGAPGSPESGSLTRSSPWMASPFRPLHRTRTGS